MLIQKYTVLIQGGAETIRRFKFSAKLTSL